MLFNRSSAQAPEVCLFREGREAEQGAGKSVERHELNLQMFGKFNGNKKRILQ